MLIIAMMIGAIALVILIIFAFPTLSPIPYFPSNIKDMPLILKALKLQNDQVILDLGAGDGIVIFKAAEEALKKSLNTKFVAIEMNPILALILNLRRLLHKNRISIQIVWGDLFKTNYHQLISDNLSSKNYSQTFYLYISPWLIQKTIEQIDKTFHNYSIVSYFYEVPGLKNPTILKGINNVHIYRN